GGKQRRSFTYIDDGIDALMKIVRNENGICDGQIFNLGNPDNDLSIRELAERMISILGEFSQLREKAEKAKIEEIPAEAYYGKEYEDMQHRVPDITRARELLKWEPKTDIDEALRRTIKFYSGISSQQAEEELGSL
ncbi:MAG: bifunctional UDP-4-keto-pentose/UDP-xylose synthase, partial [Deltaproteobacteria bacterium]